MFKLALIGCGTHSEASHAIPLSRYAAEHPGGIELTACCDLEPARAELFRREHGFLRAYGDVDGMLEAEEPDACVAVLPVRLAAGMAEKLLRRGMPNTIEKPPGSTVEEVRRLAETAAETGTPHMVSVNRRFAPLLNKAAAWARGRGPMRYVRATMIRRNRVEPTFVWSTALHCVDALRHIAGEVAAYDFVKQEAPPLSGRWYLEDFEFAGGARGRLEVITTAGMREESYDIFGEDYRVRAAFPVLPGALYGPGSLLECWSGGELRLRERAGPEEPPCVTGGPCAEVEALVASLAGGRPWFPALADVLPSAEICFDIARRAGVLGPAD